MLFDLIGMSGVIMILVCYGSVQFDRLDVKSVSYSFYNALGAGLILVSLIVDFNLSAFIIESFWVLISIIGLYKAYKGRDHEVTGK